MSRADQVTADGPDTRVAGLLDGGVDGRLNDVGPGRLVDRPVASLRPLRRYLELRRPTVPRVGQRLRPFCEPLSVTTTGTILDGYVRWQLALDDGLSNLPCLEYDLTDAEALAFVIDRQRRSSHLNAFCRIVLALELEGDFRQRNARVLGKAGKTRSSKLTNVDRTDVRADVARLAGACPANVTKVKRLLPRVIPEIREHLRRGEVSIHWASLRREMSARAQRDALWTHLNKRGIKRTIRHLIAKHATQERAIPTAEQRGAVLRSLATEDRTDVVFAVVDIPGRAIVVTQQCYEEFLERGTDDARKDAAS